MERPERKKSVLDGLNDTKSSRFYFSKEVLFLLSGVVGADGERYPSFHKLNVSESKPSCYGEIEDKEGRLEVDK